MKEYYSSLVLTCRVTAAFCACASDVRAQKRAEYLSTSCEGKALFWKRGQGAVIINMIIALRFLKDFSIYLAWPLLCHWPLYVGLGDMAQK